MFKRIVEKMVSEGHLRGCGSKKFKYNEPAEELGGWYRTVEFKKAFGLVGTVDAL